MNCRKHCKVWLYRPGDEPQIRIACPHCGHVFHSFDALNDDEDRAEESQRAHRERCPK